MKQVLSAVVLILHLSLIFAQFAGGSGTAADPYLVKTAEHLNNVRNFPGSHFRQTADIDLDVPPFNQGQGWVPIGNSLTAFTGTYHGSHHAIANLYINYLASEAGLFGETSSASLDSIILVGVDISGSMQVGGLVGLSSHTYISKCIVSGSISGEFMYGGLCGLSFFSNISNCFSCADVNNSISILGSGGLIGADQNSVITGCYATGDVSGDYVVGGLLGSAESSIISNCYSWGDVHGNSIAGGLLGSDSGANISNCYSIGSVQTSPSNGGLIGDNGNFCVTNCYWDVLTSGQTVSQGGTGLTTDDMTYPYAVNAYQNWDFTNIWASDINSTANSGYPYLQNLGVVKIVDAPVFSHSTGTYTSALHITLQTDTPGANIFYTLNGEMPTEQSLFYTAPISIDSITTLRARAFKDGWIPGSFSRATYTLQVTMPIFLPWGGYYTEPVQVTINNWTPQADVFFTLDGSEPTQQSLLYSEPFVIDTTTTVKARSYMDGWLCSGVSIAFYSFEVGADDNIAINSPLDLHASPNPFVQRTEITFSLPRSDHISLCIYNQKGQLIKTLSDAVFNKGEHTLAWDGISDAGKTVPSGVYFCRLKTGNFLRTSKLLLLR